MEYISIGLGNNSHRLLLRDSFAPLWIAIQVTRSMDTTTGAIRNLIIEHSVNCGIIKLKRETRSSAPNIGSCPGLIPALVKTVDRSHLICSQPLHSRWTGVSTWSLYTFNANRRQSLWASLYPLHNVAGTLENTSGCAAFSTKDSGPDATTRLAVTGTVTTRSTLFTRKRCPISSNTFELRASYSTWKIQIDINI